MRLVPPRIHAGVLHGFIPPRASPRVYLPLLLFFAAAFLTQGQEEKKRGLSFYREEARVICAALDDSGLAGQTLLTGIDGKASLSGAMKSIFERIAPGGIMLFRYNLDSSPDEVKNLLAECSAFVSAEAGLPPFMAVDHEGGIVRRFGPGVGKLPPALSFWELARREGKEAALAEAEALYSLSAGEIRDLGITFVLGPVAETLNAENSAFLGSRSYGSDPDFTGAAASVFVKSMAGAGIGSAVKHFPGNSAADPHTGLSVLEESKPALDEMVKPFSALIRNAEPLCVMLSHVLVPAVDSRRNASLSPYVIEDWLRGELGFDGIVLADDFTMAAVTASGLGAEGAAVEALNAGADMIMTWPSSIGAVHSSILEALRSGKLPRERLLEAAERVVAGKIQYGLVKAKIPGHDEDAGGEGP